MTAVPRGLGGVRIFRDALFQEISLCVLKVGVLNDGGGDENDEALTVALLAVMPEHHAQTREITQHGNFGVAVEGLVGDQSAHHEGVSAGDHDVRYDFGLEERIHEGLNTTNDAANRRPQPAKAL